MITLDTVRLLALSLPEVEEHPHWGRPSFRIKNKIFATLWPEDKKAMLKLSLVDQSVFVDFDRTIFYPVEGGWGLQGATYVELTKVKNAIFQEALTAAWCRVAPKGLVEKHLR